jgi:hypothetical protein
VTLSRLNEKARFAFIPGIFWEEKLNIWFGKASKEFIFSPRQVMRVSNKLRWLKTAVAVGLGLLSAGCKRQSVSTYEIPKEDYNVKPLTMAGMRRPGAGEAEEEQSAAPQLKWTLPAGWLEKSGQQQMGVGSFHITGEDGKYADVRVIPLRAGPEIESRSVNMWRGELGLAELPMEEIKGEELNVAGAHGHLYDLKSDELRFAGKFKARTTAAILERDGMLWFVKLAGEESVVAAQQSNFQEFLKSLRFETPQVASGSPAGWKVPEGWKPQKPGQMVMAAYQASKGAATAAITVASFPGDVGGVLANVNRWRGQVGLGPIDAADLAKETRTVDLAGGEKATTVDAAGKQRLYGLIVPREGKTWFYKIIGDPEVVGAEASNLVEFAARAK